ncbi:MAG: MGMT family protein [Nanoarchaeota archaeon]
MFSKKVYELVKKIPKGKVSTYKMVANKLGGRAYRAVGSALRKNKDAEVPCHRIVKSNSNIGFYNKGIKNKIKLLRNEGVKIKDNKIVDFKKILYKFEGKDL